MNNFLKKITSRKFIVTVIVMVTGIATAFKESSDEKLKAIGCIITGVAAIAYMVVEGTIDSKSIAKAIQEIISGMSKDSQNSKNSKDLTTSPESKGETNEESK